MLGAVKKRLFGIVEPGLQEDQLGRVYDFFMLGIIVLNVSFLCLETVDRIDARFHRFLVTFEFFSVLLFTLEYAVRAWVCTESPAYAHPVRGRLKYLSKPLSIVDLLSFLPYYLFMAGPNAKLISILRLARLIRLLKLAEYSKALTFLGRVIAKRKNELATTGLVAFILLVFASTLMYMLEGDAQPDKFSSIPMAMWWGVTALTTVGYGDVFPITPLGKVVGSIVAILGIGIFALPAGILGASFLEEVQAQKIEALEDLICEHCGKTTHPERVRKA